MQLKLKKKIRYLKTLKNNQKKKEEEKNVQNMSTKCKVNTQKSEKIRFFLKSHFLQKFRKFVKYYFLQNKNAVFFSFAN